VTKRIFVAVFGLLNTKSTIIKPEKKFRLRLLKGIISKENGILELKIKQATSGEKEEASP
jgi:putative membrane protein